MTISEGGKNPGAGCAHLNSSRIPESVQVQTAQTHGGPGFQEVLPSAFSQSLLKKRPLLSGNNCSIMDIRRGSGSRQPRATAPM